MSQKQTEKDKLHQRTDRPKINFLKETEARRQ